METALMRKKRERRNEKRKLKKRWEFARALAAERDGHVCQVCRNHVEGKSCNIHHILPESKKYSELHDCLNNLITLCPRCHRLGEESAHRGGFIFTLWLEKNKPEQHAFLRDYLEKKQLKGGQQQTDHGRTN